MAQLLNVGFDMCAWETFSCLLNGGTLLLRGPRRADWVAVMRQADVLVATPSILASHDPADYPNVKLVATAGEPSSKALADRWARAAQYYNCCGPTEVRPCLWLPLCAVDTGMPTDAAAAVMCR